MRKLLSILVVCALIARGGQAIAGQIWTDVNGDGLPDGSPLPVPPNTIVTVGVWIDAQSFTWTNYLAYVEWTSQCITYLSAAYVITGGSNFPIDDFSNPNAVGFGGNGFTQGGVDHIGNVSLQVNTPFGCCVAPIIDIYNPYYTFSQLGAGSEYQIFTTSSGTCFFGESFNGACCFQDGSCQQTSPAQCAAAGGIYQGDGVSCAQANCDDGLPTPQACCFCDGSCQDLTLEECVAQDGLPQGNGTSCATTGCSPPTGACCLPDGSCITVPACACELFGGVFQGGLPCEAAPCVNSVESKSWGEIKGLYR